MEVKPVSERDGCCSKEKGSTSRKAAVARHISPYTNLNCSRYWTHNVVFFLNRSFLKALSYLHTCCMADRRCSPRGCNSKSCFNLSEAPASLSQGPHLSPVGCIHRFLLEVRPGKSSRPRAATYWIWKSVRL